MGNTDVTLQGLNTADTAPPHLHDNVSHNYGISAQPAPTELNVSGISPVQACQQFLSSTHGAPDLNVRVSSSRGKPRSFPCGGVGSCGLLSLLALLTAAWTFAGLCIHRIDRTATVDVTWEPRQCAVRYAPSVPFLWPRCLDTDRELFAPNLVLFTHAGAPVGTGPHRSSR